MGSTVGAGGTSEAGSGAGGGAGGSCPCSGADKAKAAAIPANPSGLGLRIISRIPPHPLAKEDILLCSEGEDPFDERRLGLDHRSVCPCRNLRDAVGCVDV